MSGPGRQSLQLGGVGEGGGRGSWLAGPPTPVTRNREQPVLPNQVSALTLSRVTHKCDKSAARPAHFLSRCAMAILMTGHYWDVW